MSIFRFFKASCGLDSITILIGLILKRLMLQSDPDGSVEEVMYSQEFPKKYETFRDFDWEKNRFVLKFVQKHYYLVVKVHRKHLSDRQPDKKKKKNKLESGLRKRLKTSYY